MKNELRTVAFVGIVFVTLGSYAMGRTNTVVNGASDWTASDSFQDKSFVPGEGDFVIVPNGVTATVADDVSFAKVSALDGIYFQGENAVLVFDVAEGKSPMISATISSFLIPSRSSFGFGKVIKRGKGTLTLDSQARLLSGEALLDYGTSYDIQEGDLWLGQNIPVKGDVAHVPTFGRVTVAKDAVFHLPIGAGVKWSTIKWGLRGEGTVMTAADSSQIRIESDDSLDNACEFAGVLTDNVYYFSGGRVMLTGTNSTMTHGVTTYYAFSAAANGRGITGIKKIGLTTDATSSIGTGGLYTSDGCGGFLYLGEGETTDKALTMKAFPNAVNLFDAGATGGLTFTGTWHQYQGACMNQLVLSGSNTAPCVVSGPFQMMKTVDGTVSGVPYSCYLTKSGTGTWHFVDNVSRKFSGGVAAEEGRLEFDTLYEAGEVCSLGSSDLLTERYSGAWDESKKADYAFALGGTASDSYAKRDSVGAMVYTGTHPVMCLDRPIQMNGDGRFENATTNRFRFRGVKTRPGGGAKTLTIVTKATDENLIGDLEDSVADPLTVVKEGPGIWTLVNTNTIHGAIDVRKGTLVVQNIGGCKYTWYRATVRGNHGNAITTQIGEIGLFPSDGTYNNIRFAECADFPGINPGEVAYGRHFVCGKERFSGTASNLFTRTGWPAINEYARFLGYARNGDVQYCTPDPTDRRTWLPVVVRLPADRAEIYYWDIGGVVGNSDQCVKAATLEGSVDGVHWNLIERNDNIPKTSGDHTWAFYQGQTFVNWGIYGSDVSKRHRLPCRGADTNSYDILSGVSAVSVAAGATLRGEGAKMTISRIRIDAAQAAAGNIENFDLAENGTIEVVNGANRSGKMPIKLSDVGGTGNISKWSVVVDGEAKPNYSVASDGSGITLYKPGVMIIFK